MKNPADSPPSPSRNVTEFLKVFPFPHPESPSVADQIQPTADTQDVARYRRSVNGISFRLFLPDQQPFHRLHMQRYRVRDRSKMTKSLPLRSDDLPVVRPDYIRRSGSYPTDPVQRLPEMPDVLRRNPVGGFGSDGQQQLVIFAARNGQLDGRTGRYPLDGSRRRSSTLPEYEAGRKRVRPKYPSSHALPVGSPARSLR